MFLLAPGKGALLKRELAAAGNVWRIARERVAGHPAPFPVALAGRCIEATLAPGPVLDPFCGSGSALVAAARAGRDGLGVELSERYCGLARERLGQLTMLAG